MKKILSSLLTAFILVSTMLPFTSVSAADAWVANEAISTAPLIVGLVGDSHITGNNNTLTQFKAALAAHEGLSGGNVDVLAMTGDIIYQNDSTQVLNNRYDELMPALAEAGYALTPTEGQKPFIYTMGNHEFPQSNNDATISADSIKLFEEKTGQTAKYHTEVEGYHFIAANADAYHNRFSTDTETWLETEINAAIADGGVNQPVFVLLHSPTDEFFGTNYNSYSADFKAYLQSKPQVVMLSAHMHIPAQLPETIYQNGYTEFQTPLTVGGYLTEWGATSSGNINDVYQSSMLTVDKNNVVKIYKIDLNNKSLIGEPWVLDIPAMVADTSKTGAAWKYSADKRTNPAKPTWPADAAIETTLSGDVLTVTYPNSAICTDTSDQQETFVRGYKVEAVVKSTGAKLASYTYMNPFYKAEAQPASYTRTIANLPYEQEINVTVTPIGPLNGLGTPLTATVTTGEDPTSENAIRYEFEDYVPSAWSSIVKNCDYSSNGRLILSSQNGDLLSSGSASNLARSCETTSMTFDVDVPIEGKYNIEYTLGKTDTVNTCPLTVTLDKGTDKEQVLGNNKTLGEDASLGLNYPWSPIAMQKYKKSDIELTEGTHTVTLSYELPTRETQPVLFTADYIQFTPQIAMISQYQGAKHEFENANLSADFKVDNTTPLVPSTAYGPLAIYRGVASGGGYVWFDTNNSYQNSEVLHYSFDVYAEDEVEYNFEFIASDATGFSWYLDDEETAFLTSGTNKKALDSRPAEGENYPYFDQYWHAAYSFSTTKKLTAGKHTITMKMTARGSTNYDFALCMDVFKITPKNPPATIAAEGATRVEFEDYTLSPNIAMSDSPWTEADSGHTIVYHNYNGGSYTTDVATMTIPVTFEESDYYNFEYLFGSARTNTTNLSKVEVAIDGVVVGDNVSDFTTAEEVANITEWGTNAQGHKIAVHGDYIKWISALMTKFTKNAYYVEAGNHVITINVYKNTNNKIFNFQMDYLEIKPDRADTVAISAEKATRIEMENYQEYTRIPQELNATEPIWTHKIGESKGASGGQYLHIDSTDKGTAELYYTIKIPITVEKTGTYNIESVAVAGCSATELFVDSVASTAVLNYDSSTNAVLDTAKTVNSKGEAGTTHYPTFTSSWGAGQRRFSSTTLTAGEHTLLLRVKNRSVTGLQDFAKYIDYIDLVPVDNIKIENGTATALANFTDISTGKAILALYNGEELVKIESIDINKTKYAEIKAAVTGNVTGAKVFVWDDFESVTPQTKPVVFATIS